MIIINIIFETTGGHHIKLDKNAKLSNDIMEFFKNKQGPETGVFEVSDGSCKLCISRTPRFIIAREKI